MRGPLNLAKKLSDLGFHAVTQGLSQLGRELLSPHVLSCTFHIPALQM